MLNWPSSGSRGVFVEIAMAKTNQEQPVATDVVLKIAKEISVKFIEVGRLTPATFDETFKSIYRTIEETVRDDD